MKIKHILVPIKYFNKVKGFQTISVAMVMFTIGLFFLIQPLSVLAGLKAAPTTTKNIKTSTSKIPITPKKAPFVEQATPVPQKKTIVQPLAPLKPALKVAPGSSKIIKIPEVTELASTATMTVTKPELNQRVRKGSTCSIKWIKSGIQDSTVKIKLFKSPSLIPVIDISSSTVNDGSFSWQVPGNFETGNYTIRITTLNNAMFSYSKAFKIVKPLKLNFTKTITVQSPDAGFYRKGENIQIKWNSKFVTGVVKIELQKSNGSGGVIKANHPYNATPFTWKIGKNIALGNYIVRVRQGSVKGESASFEIKRPKLKLNLTPKITGLITIGNAQPWGTIRTHKLVNYCTKFVIKGKNFLNQKGKVLLYGDFSNINGGPVRSIPIESWTNTRIVARTPIFLNGATNQKVKVVVETHVKPSNWRELNFEGREEKKIKVHDVVCKRCHKGSIYESNDEFNVKPDAHCQEEQTTVSAYHPASSTETNIAGTDIFEINLKNGWTYSRSEVIQWSGIIGVGNPYPVMPVGKSGKWELLYDWTTLGNNGGYVSNVRYKQNFYATGPIGTHYK